MQIMSREHNPENKPETRGKPKESRVAARPRIAG